MGAVGGDILEAAYSHPTIGSGTLFPKANEDSTLDLGGLRKDDDSSNIDGAGNHIVKMNRTTWMAEMTIANDINTRNDSDKVDKLSESPVAATWTITHVSGAVYQGLGTIVGDVQPNLNSATIKIKIAGGGKLKKIAG